MSTAILLLAAGASSRMGQPKMFLTYQGSSLLQHAVQAATATSPHCFVVAGALAWEIAIELRDDPVRVIHHTGWEAGIGSSIAVGVTSILNTKLQPSNILITVCDQPFIDHALLQQLIDQQAHTSKGIIACAYEDTIGTPVLFDQQYFPALQALSGQQGAKKILQEHPDAVATVDFPRGAFDIDTPEDYARLQNL
ncbi:nucleotidyltransferase family protein [Paraflavitalea pollutisoli]|uniref:nucleotidyltransferase family protein n=1 Tax=Paraflavitalea pollutisoli TaxID=3034143 RepID=UPI0023ED652A|nr:nucleotidyltransferase family protein [Paraflavitalea sp. H1-2-19X]